MSELEVFASQIRERIPLSRHLDFQLLAWDGESLTLSAGLEVNVNDKGTLFAGSQAALLTLAGWAYATLLARPLNVDVVAGASTVAYQAPIRADVQIFATAEPDSRDRFRQRLVRRGKAPLSVMVRAGEQVGSWASEFQGSYLATLVPDSTPSD